MMQLLCTTGGVLRTGLLVSLLWWGGMAWPARAASLVIATVDNEHMLQLQSLSKVFEKAHPDIKIRWVTLKEHELRRFVSSDIATQAAQVDIVTIGMYEVGIWARRGWLKPIRPAADYGLDDLLDNIREGLSYQRTLYAAPLYGESSILMYRKDLLAKAGEHMPAKPTWQEVARLAGKLNDPTRGVHGICLRGSPGWGENITLVTTMVNAHGGQWFDMGWTPQLESQPWQDAVGLYVDLLRRYGPEDAASRGYNENLALFLQGKCALWVDASVAAGFVSDPKYSRWSGTVGFARAPSAVTAKGSHWLWAWALAIPSSVDAEREAAAQQFVHWATSRAYIELVAATNGWRLVPSGTRKSTYARAPFQRAAPWAAVELEAIRNANPRDATLPPSPYAGVQFAVIPEFRDIGDAVGGFIASAVNGQSTVAEALAKSQFMARRQMLLGGYPETGKTASGCPAGTCR